MVAMGLYREVGSGIGSELGCATRYARHDTRTGASRAHGARGGEGVVKPTCAFQAWALKSPSEHEQPSP